MIVATSLLLFVFISQDFPACDAYGEKSPRKCYTCTSLLSSRLCGNNFRKINFLVKDCRDDTKYCMKIVETAGRNAFMYRKCSSHDCDEEVKMRDGVVSDCSLCTTSLCNKASILHHKTTMFFSAVLLLYHYIQS